jgi:putative redox protein
VRELREIRPLSLAAKLAPRPLLLVQGADDETVPALDARALADWHGSAELRVIGGAGHRLRHDPRAIAVLIGWLERQALS